MKQPQYDTVHLTSKEELQEAHSAYARRLRHWNMHVLLQATMHRHLKATSNTDTTALKRIRYMPAITLLYFATRLAYEAHSMACILQRQLRATCTHTGDTALECMAACVQSCFCSWTPINLWTPHHWHAYSCRLNQHMAATALQRIYIHAGATMHSQSEATPTNWRPQRWNT